MSLLEIDDDDDDDDDDDEIDNAFDTTVMSLPISFKSLSDNRPSDKTASLKVFWSIWRQRLIVAGLSKSPATRSLSNIHVYIRKKV